MAHFVEVYTFSCQTKDWQIVSGRRSCVSSIRKAQDKWFTDCKHHTAGKFVKNKSDCDDFNCHTHTSHALLILWLFSCISVELNYWVAYTLMFQPCGLHQGFVCMFADVTVFFLMLPLYLHVFNRSWFWLSSTDDFIEEAYIFHISTVWVHLPHSSHGIGHMISLKMTQNLQHFYLTLDTVSNIQIFFNFFLPKLMLKSKWVAGVFLALPLGGTLVTLTHLFLILWWSAWLHSSPVR